MTRVSLSVEEHDLTRERKRGPADAAHRVVSGFTRVDLARKFGALGFTRGVEVGVADGRYSEVLCREISGLQLVCVDPWRKYDGNKRGGPQEQHNKNYEVAQQRLRGKASLWRMYSRDAAWAWRATVGTIGPDYGKRAHELLDFVYIDGNHAFDYVMEDLIEWSQNVRRGGIVAGHDYYHFKWAGVVEAVNAYTHAHGITDWHLTDEREPSFWWVKP